MTMTYGGGGSTHGIGGGGGGGGRSGGVDWDAERDRFIAAVKSKAADAGLGVAPNCLQLFTDLIDKGLGVLRSQQSPAVEVERAYQNLHRALDLAIKDAQVKQYTELHEDDYAFAVSRFCPMWPFC
jgi:hypothetical protein